MDETVVERESDVQLLSQLESRTSPWLQARERQCEVQRGLEHSRTRSTVFASNNHGSAPTTARIKTSSESIDLAIGPIVDSIPS